MLRLDMEQGSESWFQAKLGIPSSSNFDKILTPATGKPSASAKNYMYRLAGERITGVPSETYQNATMQRAIELESEARSAFEFMEDQTVELVGVCYPDEKRRYCCSPDGLLADGTGLEIKCPILHTHVGYLMSGTLPRDYITQVQGSMLVTGASFWHFMSYYPGLTSLIIKVPRDVEYLIKLKVALDMFCAELDKTVEKLR